MIVAKIGGSRGVDLDLVCDDAARLARDGVPLVLVHGGSAATDELARALGHPPRTVTSPSGRTSRLTDRRTLEIFTTACAGVGRSVVERLQRRGADAIALSGLDGRLWAGRRKRVLKVVEDGRERILRDTWTGTVDRVDADLLRALLGRGLLPVVGPPGSGEEGEALNVDGDRAAAATAVALGAGTLLLLTNVPGLLARFPDESSLVRRVDRGRLDEADELATGRMRAKLQGAREALAGGVARVVIGSARGAEPLRRALDGEGTAIA